MIIIIFYIHFYLYFCRQGAQIVWRRCRCNFPFSGKWKPRASSQESTARAFAPFGCFSITGGFRVSWLMTILFTPAISILRENADADGASGLEGLPRWSVWDRADTFVFSPADCVELCDLHIWSLQIIKKTSFVQVFSIYIYIWNSFVYIYVLFAASCGGLFLAQT